MIFEDIYNCYNCFCFLFIHLILLILDHFFYKFI